MRIYQFKAEQKKNFALLSLNTIPTSPLMLIDLCKGEKMPSVDTKGVVFINDSWGVVVANDIHAASELLKRQKYAYVNESDDKLFFVKDFTPANKFVSAY